MMNDIVYKFQDLSKYERSAWETMDFSEFQKKCARIDCTLLELSKKLQDNQIDCVWFDNEYERVIWTRSLKQKNTIQVTSFNHRLQTPNSDEQVSNAEELLRSARESSVYTGIELHVLVNK